VKPIELAVLNRILMGSQGIVGPVSY